MPNFARLPVTGSDANTWSDILNRQITQTTNAVNGSFNSFDQFSSRPTNLTADDLGKTYLHTQTGNWHEWNGSMWKVQNKSEINVKDYGAIGDGVVDDTVAIQGAIDYSAIVYATSTLEAKGVVFFPQGKYRVTKTLDLGSTGYMLPGFTRPSTFRYGVHLHFEKRSSLTEKGTVLIGETGNKPVLELTESDGATLENVAILAGSTNPSTIGILAARSSNGTSFGTCFKHIYKNVYINLKSNPNVNGGLGTIGLINISAEEHTYDNLEIWANTCVIISSTYKLKFVNKQFNGFSTFNVQSALGFQIADDWTTTFIVFSGMCRLISYDYTSPAVLLYTNNNNPATNNIFLNNTYISKTGNLIDGTPTKSSDGAYDYIIETFTTEGLTHYSQGESFGRYMIIHGDFNNCDIRESMDANILFPLSPHDSDPYFLLWGVGANRTLSNSKIIINPGKLNIPLIGWRENTSVNSTSFSIANLEIKTRQLYKSNMIQKGILKNTTNSTFSFLDRKLEISDNSQSTTIKKPIGTNTSSAVNLFSMELPTVVANNAGFSATCNISGSLTNASPTVSNSSTVSFNSTFSLSTQASNGDITITPVVTVIGSGANINNGINTITNLTFTLDITTITNTVIVKVKPNTTGSANAAVNLTGEIKVTYSDAFQNNIVLSF